MKTIKGKVVSTKMEKTAIVNVERLWKHPVYNKRVKRSTRYMVHTEIPVEEGQNVLIAETTPISKNKRWKLIEIIKQN